MSDPLLTTLCTICHREPPKYKCPRCGVRTCSLPCIKKHKAWASCSGERDPASFVPRERLVTDAGVDHDYNFISKIERAKELFEKKVVGEKGLLGEAEIRGPQRPGAVDRRFEKVWYGDQLVHEPVAKSGGGGRGGRWNQALGGGAGGPAAGRDALHARFDQQVRQRLRRNDIRVLTMPKGLSRQKENKTAWNRRTGTINWQVEWLLFGVEAGSGEAGEIPARICHKSLDEKPLYQCLAETLEWNRSAAQTRKRERDQGVLGDDDDDEEPPHKKQKPLTRRQRAMQHVEAMIPSQDSSSSTWPGSEYTVQCTVTGRWNQTSSDPSVSKSSEEEAAELSKLRFFLFKPGTPDDPSKGLIPLTPIDNLIGVLAGRTVIEFPTIYVLQAGAALPDGLSLASVGRRTKEPEAGSDGDQTEGKLHKAAVRRGRAFGRSAGHDGSFDATSANQAPVQNNRLSGRRGQQANGGSHRPRKRVEFAVPAEEDVEEGELNSDGEEAYNARAAMDMVTASITADASSFAGGGGVADPEPASKPPKSLVDYGSDSE